MVRGGRVRKFAFHKQDRLAITNHDKIDLPFIGISEVAQLLTPSLGVLAVMTPFEQVASDQTLKPESLVCNLRPIIMVMLGFFFYRADRRRSKGVNPENGIKPLKNIQPPRNRLVGHSKILTQRIDRKWASDQIRKPDRQHLNRADVLDEFKLAQILSHQPGPIITAPNASLRGIFF